MMPQADIPQGDPTAVWQQFLTRWLAQAPERLAQTARLAALPLAFDVALLAALRGLPQTETAVDLATLEQAGFLSQQANDQYSLSPIIRTLLRQRWLEDEPTAYRHYHRLAAAAVGQVDQRTHVYHQLGAEDAQGIEALTAVLDQAQAVHDWGLVEQMLTAAQEHWPVLGPAARAWLRYWQAQLALLQYRFPEAEDDLQTLSQETLPLALAARLQASQGAIFAATQRWGLALEAFAAAQTHYQSLEQPGSAAAMWEQQGTVYLTLATYLGGLPNEESARAVSPQHWLNIVTQAPFLLYRTLSRRLPFLPSLYFGTNYQDWIIVRLLEAAIDCLEKAQRLLANQTGLGELALSTDLLIRLADLYHRTERWPRAAQLFKRLAQDPLVMASGYRQATLWLAQGRAGQASGRLHEAQERLAAASAGFARYGDQQGVAVANRLLGEMAVAQGEEATAVAYYRTSAQAAQSANDLLAVTHAWAALQTLPDPPDTPQTTPPQLAFVARFPGYLLHRLRKLTLYGVIPLGYLMLWSVSLLLLGPLSWIETFVVQSPNGTTAVLVEIMSKGTATLLVLLLTIWFYLGVYLWVGWRFVRRLPLAEIAQKQPQYIVTTPEELMVRQETGQTTAVRWSELSTWYSLDQAILPQRPLLLFSRLVVRAQGQTAVLEGITSHYQLLQQLIARRLGHKQPESAAGQFAWVLLNGRWLILTLLLTLGFTIIDFMGWLDPEQEISAVGVTLANGSHYTLYLTGFLYRFSVWLWQMLPLLGLGRLLANRSAIRRTLGTELPLGPDWPIWLAFGLLLLLFGLTFAGLLA